MVRAQGRVSSYELSLPSSVPSPLLLRRGRFAEGHSSLAGLENEVVVASCHRQLFNVPEDGEVESFESVLLALVPCVESALGPETEEFFRSIWWCSRAQYEIPLENANKMRI